MRRRRAARTSHPRALVLAPFYDWTDAAPDIEDVVAVLAQAGVPFDVQPGASGWQAALDSLATEGRYSMAVLPGYLLGSVLRAEGREKLQQFAERGGVVVVFKPVGGAADAGRKEALDLVGLRGAERRRDVTTLQFEATLPGAFAALDTPEERTLQINAHAAPDAVEVYGFDPAPSTEVIARGRVATGASVPVITRRAVGKGAVYAFGHDLATFADARCYVNCFEPAGDVLRLFFDGALRESAGGHVVIKHTVPGVASSALILTHDVDAPDAENTGEWGKAGALQVAEAERARGVQATFNVTTDYVAHYFNPEVVTSLCALGMCPIGAHSVTHVGDFGHLPHGTCTETRATYGARRTMCGEIHVSLDILRGLTGKTPRVWRAPYLETSADELGLLASSGVAYDSSFGVGDLPYNLPVDLEHVGFHQDRYRHDKLLEFPVACEDGEGALQGSQRLRQELQGSNRAQFVGSWEYIALANARNRAFTTVLVHPSRGREQPIANLKVKVDAVIDLLGRVASFDLVVKPMEEMGDFWRARLEATLDATYDDASGYSGSLTIGRSTAPGLSLELGDRIRSFDCKACGPVEIKGKRVVLTSALPPGTRATFRATTR